jgi:cyclophilin family peptidyl-prolyl cis-trans isomerase
MVAFAVFVRHPLPGDVQGVAAGSSMNQGEPMFWRGCVLALALTSSTLLAQQAAQQPAKKEPPAAGQADKPAAAEKPAAADQAAATAFDQKLTEWKGILSELERIRAAWKIGMPDERKKLEKEFNDELAKGEALLPEIIKTAEAAFAGDDASKQTAGEFLAAVAHTSGQEDDYELAAHLTGVLLAGGFEAKGLNDLAGRAAFATNDFDNAEKYLNAAKEKGGLSQQAERDLGEIDAYKKYWETEKELRAAEAKADDLPRVEIKTNKGTIVVELFENEAPNTVANFISLVEKGFYNGTPFHRVLPDFMAQGGDPTGSGSGGPEYTIKCECYEPNHRVHFRGSLSMAHAGKDTGGSQFFLTFRPTAHLNSKPGPPPSGHTVFGRIIEGMDVLAKIQRRDPSDPNAPNPDKIVEAKVLRKRDHEYKPVTQPDKK